MCGEASFKVAAAAFDSLGFLFLPQDFESDSPTSSQKNMTCQCEKDGELDDNIADKTILTCQCWKVRKSKS